MRVKKIYYGWYVVLVSAVLTAVGLGMFSSTNSVFVKPVCESLGFARAEFTFHRTIITLIGMLVMPLYGRLIVKVGVKKILLTGAIMLGLVTAGYSFANKIWHFYLLALINGIFLNGVSFMSIGILINAWFDGKKGLATGLAYAGSGFGGAVMIPVTGKIIEWTSWQWAYRFIGILGILVLLPIIILFVKNSPADMGLKPLPADKNQMKQGNRNQNSYDFHQALRSGKFWLVVTAFFLINFFAGCTNTHTVPYLSDIGYPVAFTASVMSVFMVFLILGKVILGIIYDRLGSLAGNLIIAFFSLGFPVLALLASNPAMPWLYAMFIGMASSGVSVPIAVLVNRYFGDKDFPAIFSFCSMIAVFAPSISVPAMGAVYDTTGSYRPAWWGLFILSVLITVCLVGAEWLNRRPQVVIVGNKLAE